MIVAQRETDWWSSAVKSAWVFRLRITPTPAARGKEDTGARFCVFWKHRRAVKGFPGPDLKSNRQDSNH